MPPPFFTIGHSTRSIAEFVDLLRAGEVAHVADIRTVPRSRTNPQYNSDVLPGTLSDYGVGYTLIAELGGLRAKSKTVAPEVNGFWSNASFHNYADYALTQPFADGLAELIALGRERRVAMMCSEAVWWRCHRRIVADYLLARGETVRHLMGGDRVEPARLTPGAVPGGDGTVVYPAPAN
jgi:uncharacterized protein (DUF488 family)